MFRVQPAPRSLMRWARLKGRVGLRANRPPSPLLFRQRARSVRVGLDSRCGQREPRRRSTRHGHSRPWLGFRNTRMAQTFPKYLRPAAFPKPALRPPRRFHYSRNSCASQAPRHAAIRCFVQSFPKVSQFAHFLLQNRAYSYHKFQKSPLPVPAARSTPTKLIPTSCLCYSTLSR
jgi:hypothetical protein